MKNKRAITYLLFVFIISAIYAQQDNALLQEMLNSRSIKFPFEYTKRSLRNSFVIPASKNKLLDFNIYSDIRKLCLKEKTSELRVLGRFNLLHEKHVFWVECGDLNNEWRQFFLVMDTDGNLINTLEVASGYGKNVLTKHFTVNKDRTIDTYQVFSYCSDTIPYATFSSFFGARLDERYKFSNTGRIELVAEQLYFGKEYKREEFENQSNDLSKGNEKTTKRYYPGISRIPEMDIDSLALPFDLVDIKPQYPSGATAMQNYIDSMVMKQRKNPAYTNIAGRVIIEFIVSKEGYPCNLRVKQGIDNLSDFFAKEVIRLMPRWNPGVHNGEEVPVRYQLSVNIPIQ